MEHTRHGYWLQEVGPVQPAPSLVGGASADVVVLGGGFTGLWTAWHLKQLEPEARVTLLEADLCGNGPSGRNGGFCNVMWFSLPNMRRRWGDEGALAVARASSEAVAGIGEFCAEQGVDAWYRHGGYLQVSAAPAQDGIWGEPVEACRELGVADAVEPLSPEGVAAHCASRSACASGCGPPASRFTSTRRSGACGPRRAESRLRPTAAGSAPAPRWWRSAAPPGPAAGRSTTG